MPPSPGDLLALCDEALDGPMGYVMAEFDDGALLAVSEEFLRSTSGWEDLPETTILVRDDRKVYFFQLTDDQVAELKSRV